MPYPDYAPTPTHVLSLHAVCPSARIDEFTTTSGYAYPPLNAPWTKLNPSIAARPDGGFRIVHRCSNFAIGPSGEYLIHDGTGPGIRTLNFLVDLDGHLEQEGIGVLPFRPPGPSLHPAYVDGVEDIRLVYVDGRCWGIGAVWDRTPDLAAHQCLVDIDAARLRLLDPPHASGPEKNWMPFVADGVLHVLYTTEPCVVLRVDLDTALVDTVSVTSLDVPRLAVTRGGSQGVEVDGVWYFVVHEASLESGRVYTHRIVAMERRDDGFAIAAVSRLFSFTGAPVEFCCGAALAGGDVVLSFGVGEQAMFVARVALPEFTAAPWLWPHDKF